ncbi:hypothetical protein F5Y16DRAFT_389831 [Xylariaceae sp. FL0255]|nr:hypothetical protein F5Y16DRAFT_389831 [Xylariaceae sp. FL0255]
MKLVIALWAWAVSLALAAPVYSIPSRPQHSRVQIQASSHAKPAAVESITTSSIVDEETKAITLDFEPEASIIEWETKASRESWAWVPCVSHDQKLHYERVRIYADHLVVGLVLSFVAVVLIIELWMPVAERIRRARTGYGPIYLDETGSMKVATSDSK